MKKIVLSVLLVATMCGSAVAAKEEVGPSPLKLYGEIDVVNAACGAAGVSLSSKQFPCKIDKVRMGSPAAYAGLCQNDKVLKADIEGNKLTILIERKGQKYGVKLNTSRDPIVTVTATADKPAPVSQVDQTVALKEISKYNIALIIDRSGSMSSELGSEDSSKWEWCRNHISTFARDIAPLLLDDQLTMLFFDNEFSIVRHCTPNTVQRTFYELEPRGGTIMAPPMAAVFNEYFAGHHGRPLLVIVLTDGLPGDYDAVEKSIINATKLLPDAGQMKIRFLEIGDQYSGSALLELLDTHLVSQGAKYDIVDYASFEEVKSLGLARAMIAKVSPVKSKNYAASDSMEAQLYALRKEIETLNGKSEPPAKPK